MPESLPAASALVVDDDPRDLAATLGILRAAGMSPESVNSGDDACALLESKPFGLVITDIVMHGMNGFDVVQQALKADPNCICITVTSFGSLESALDSLRFGAYSFAQKPLNSGELLHVVRRGLEKQRLTKELMARNEQLQKLNAELESRVRAATQELRDLNQRVLNEMASLKEVDALKSSFLGNVSHDLRSPLTMIRGYLGHLLEQPSLPEETRQCLTAVEKAGQHMEYLVAQLLDAAQLTSGTVRLNLSDFSASELLKECAVLMEPQARTAGIELLAAPADPGLTLRADRGRLLQVLSNLAGNACKFTPRGGRVTLSARSQGPDALFCVEDTGPGILAEHREKIFERFFQSGATADNASKGLGLGLNIVKDVVALHGGRVWVESEPGRGARFFFTVPPTPPLTNKR